jgi:hypothetical protein
MAERFFRITIRGVLTGRLAAAFEPLRLAAAADDLTVLSGVCVDSAALYGILDRLRDLGLELLAVESSALVPRPVRQEDEVVGTPRDGRPGRPRRR